MSSQTTTWSLDCGCSGTLAPNEVTDTCPRHEYRKGMGFTGDKAPKTMDSPAPILEPLADSPQHQSYFVLSAVDRARGFVRPVRRTYVHLKCGAATTMGQQIAETYAANPTFYGATFCVSCGSHFPVGEHGEFVWDDGSKVGT